MSNPIDPRFSAENKLQEHIDGLYSVLDGTNELAAEKDLDRLFGLIIERACGALGCERASLFFFDEQRRQLYTRKVTKLDGIHEIRLSIDKGIAGLVARTRSSVVVLDPYQHPEFDSQFDLASGFRTRNILCAPLLSWGKEEKLLGVLQVLNKCDRPFDDSDQTLMRAFAAHAAIAVDRAILAKHYEEKIQLLVSLNLARQVQAGLLPRRLPDIPGYEIAAISRPADQTGGDYYDAIPLDAGQIGLVVADVSGHGFGPSLLMATARAMLRGIARREPAAEVVLNELSRAILEDLQHVKRFITLLHGTLDPSQHLFRYANAGHGPVALHLNAEQRAFHSLVDDDARGYPLGWFEQCFAPCAPVPLGPGDMIVLGTDGFVETRKGGEQFGMERLCQYILSHARDPLPEIIEGLASETLSFHDKESPLDDLTLVIARRNAE